MIESFRVIWPMPKCYWVFKVRAHKAVVMAEVGSLVVQSLAVSIGD